MDRGGGELLHQLQLALAVAGAHGDGQGPQPFGAVVEPQPPGEQAVAHHVLKHVRGPHPGHVQGAGHQVGPGLDIGPGVIDHRGLARGPGGGVEPHHVGERPGQHLPAVGPKIVFGGKRNPADILQGPEVGGGNARFL